MCGIAGHLAFPAADPEAVRRMSNALRHRGPDGDGLLVDGPVALGHRRLSIIDVGGGAQPIFNEDRSVAVVLNGEIYNYRELAEELRGRHTFRTVSDTEVLVHLYEDLGEGMLERLRGMFAFALWDARARKLLVARDRLGKKPVLYVQAEGALWFASELGALEAAGAPLGAVDRRALSDYLELLYVPAPRTVWTGARKLEPGHLLVADAAGVRVRRYWSPPQPGTARPTASLDELGERVRSTLEESVRLRLRSDVPLGVLLSGGIDSSTVVALAAREVGPGLSTFAVGFGRADDELPFARAVAERYATKHHEIIIDEGARDATERALEAFSEPFGDSSAVPTLEVFRAVAREVKVVLTGDGGDELFAGYDRYRRVEGLPSVPGAGRMTPWLDRLPAWGALPRVRRAARMLGTRRASRYRAMIEVFTHSERRSLLDGSAGVAQSVPDSPTDVDSALAFDLSVYLPDDLLVKTDIASMHWSLEARCPLLDHVLTEQVVPLPARFKQDARQGKLVLREAVGELLPAVVRARAKRGFGSPVDAWLRGPLRPMLGDLVESRRSPLRDWLDGGAIDRVMRHATSGRGNAHQAWALLALAGWGAGRSGPRPATRAHGA
jgi:asparagine synthase (glutamine-hydrolysing)